MRRYHIFVELNIDHKNERNVRELKKQIETDLDKKLAKTNEGYNYHRRAKKIFIANLSQIQNTEH